jgi:tetratricopeptide (TPR) repeat protein
MIAALSPKVSNIQGTTKELPAAADQSPEKSRQPDNGDESFTPKADWKKRDYNFTLFNAIAYGTDQQVQNIQESFLASPFGGSEIDQKRWAAYGHFCRIITGKDGRLSELKEAADSNPNDSEIWGYLARSYLQYDEFASAAHAFERAANSAPAMAQRVKLLGEAAVASHQNRNEVDTNRLSDQIIALMETNNIIESNVLLAEKAIAEETRNNEAYIGTFERLLELDPSNADYRYSLAHKYSDLGMDGSSAFHYSKIPIRERNASVWNNLGVAFDRLGVEGLSVDAYRASERLGETLAMSNIALKYLSAGFLEEADAILKRAVVIPDHDKNVERAMVRVGTQTEAEQKKEAETFETAQKTSDFYRAFGRALVRVIGTGLTGTWKANECDVSATVTGRDFAAIGTYEVPQGLGFLSNAFLQTYAGVEQSKDRMRMEYRGIIHGRTIVGTVTRQKEGALPKATSILDSAESSPKMLMFLMDGDDSLSVLEQSGSAVRFYSLKKV